MFLHHISYNSAVLLIMCWVLHCAISLQLASFPFTATLLILFVQLLCYNNNQCGHACKNRRQSKQTKQVTLLRHLSLKTYLKYKLDSSCCQLRLISMYNTSPCPSGKPDTGRRRNQKEMERWLDPITKFSLIQLDLVMDENNIPMMTFQKPPMNKQMSFPGYWAIWSLYWAYTVYLSGTDNNPGH